MNAQNTQQNNQYPVSMPVYEYSPDKQSEYQGYSTLFKILAWISGIIGSVGFLISMLNIDFFLAVFLTNGFYLMFVFIVLYYLDEILSELKRILKSRQTASTCEFLVKLQAIYIFSRK